LATWLFAPADQKQISLERRLGQAKQFAIDCATPLNLPPELDAILGDHFFAGSSLENDSHLCSAEHKCESFSRLQSKEVKM